MDPSSLIFVALAIAWAVYLVPKALKHHDDAVRSRSVDRFSQTMRVLARREPVSRRDARLVVGPRRPVSEPIVTSKPTTPRPAVAPVTMTRAKANAAARRRRRVLSLILVALTAVAAVAAAGVIHWGYVAIPGAVLVAWLVACRLMVRKETRVRLSVQWPARAEVVADQVEQPAPDVDLLEDTTSTPALTDERLGDPSLWDPMPMTLPTYVSKPPAARRSVRTIDLDSTGVWTSGRTEADAQLAREADEAARAQRSEQAGDEQRATGS